MSSTSDDIFSDEALLHLSDFIGHEWELLAFNLGLPRKQVGLLAVSSKKDHKKKVFHMLKTWRENTSEKRVESFIRALETSSRKDLAEKIHCAKWSKKKAESPCKPNSCPMLIKIAKVNQKATPGELRKINDLNPSTARPVHSHNTKFLPVG